MTPTPPLIQNPNRACRLCIHYRPKTDTRGECRRHSPDPIIGWPEVAPDEWCSEYVANGLTPLRCQEGGLQPELPAIDDERRCTNAALPGYRVCRRCAEFYGSIEDLGR